MKIKEKFMKLMKIKNEFRKKKSQNFKHYNL